MCMYTHTCVCLYLCLCGYINLLSVWLCARACVCMRCDTHPLYERHITLQMTLLDGDGPFNYSTLMQSAVNTLNQAAEEEAAYPSSLLFLHLFFPLLLLLCLYLFLPLLLPLSLICSISFHYICLILVFLLYTLWFPSPSLPLSESTACRHSPVSKLH